MTTGLLLIDNDIQYRINARYASERGVGDDQRPAETPNTGEYMEEKENSAPYRHIYILG